MFSRRTNAMVILGFAFVLGVAFAFLASFTSVLRAQSTNASLTGRVTDPTKALIADAKIAAISAGTNVRYETTTNGSGEYYLANLPPGSYRIEIEKAGFKKLIKPDVIVHVQDALAIDFAMTLGATSETITVEAGAPLVNNESGTVSTVIDRTFVENMPLNGRSFQALIALTPGNVTAKAYYTGIGQFSINGQRTDANYFSIDGVSANVGITQGANYALGASAAGAAQANSNNGGYNNLVSIDALQEYKIQTSTFAPEYGRTPGAQLSIVTRSGSNQWHGNLFEYLRNEVFDSRDYFARVNNLPKPGEKQNDFGGTLGGPILRARLFFFFSYEGLRLRVPFTRTEIVPSASLRASAIPAVAPLLSAYPLPTKDDVAGMPTATTVSTFSDPSVLNASSLRLDYAATPKLSLFVRGNHGPSNGAQYGAFGVYTASTLSHTISNVDTLIAGATYLISSQLVSDFRVNLSHAKGATVVDPTNFGGATAPSQQYLFSSNPNVSLQTGVFLSFMLDGSSGYYVGNDATNRQKQFNLVDSLGWSRGSHNFKYGVDYRRLSPTQGDTVWGILYLANSFAELANGTIFEARVDTRDTSELRPVFTNVSLYAQDAWRVMPRLTLTYGVRWDYDPPPSENSGHPFFTATNLTDPPNVALAPEGTPLWNANKHNFAPRLGFAYTWNNEPGKELVLRGGGGIFYGLGNQQGAQGMIGSPYYRSKTLLGTGCGCGGTYSFPISVADGAPVPFTLNPPHTFVYAFDPHLKDPRVYQWNFTVERALGSSRSLQLTYVGNKGADLLRRNMLTPAMGGNPDFTFLDVVTNEGYSNYHALQAQFKQRPWHGLQFLASYTWAHAIDNGSSVNLPNPYTNVYNPAWDRGNSDFDIRQTFAAALTYELPRTHGKRVLGAVTSNWALDSLFRSNTATPVDVTTGVFPAFGLDWTADAGDQRPNVVPGQPFSLYGSQYPGGKRINAAAFSTPANSFTQGNLGRNTVRGFGAWQEDLAIRRTFTITERVSLLFRAEAFNIFNHSNFGDPGAQSDDANHLNSPNFGLSTQILSNSLGTGGADGGFSPLYQIGGPRSIQFALKLQF